jgi:zinc transporter 9
MPGWIAALAIASVTFLGAFAAGLLPRYFKLSKLYFALPGIAAGLLLASALGLVLPEGFAIVLHDFPNARIPSELIGGIAALLGFLFMLGLESGGMAHEPLKGQRPLHSLALGLGIHELTDGLALGASLATDSLALTLPILAAVLVHRIPVAFGLGAFLWHSQEVMHPLRTLLGFSLATPLGVVITFSLFERLAHGWLGVWLLFSGGTFLYVAAVDALGRVRQDSSGMQVFCLVGLGGILMIAALILLESLGEGF